MWRLNPHHGAVLEPEEYVDSVRLRLGCAGPREPAPCAACQSGSLDTDAAHTSCCALGEDTRGLNAVTSLVHAAAQSFDCTAETEVPGLVPGTTSDPPTSSPPPQATLTPPSTSRSALRTPSRPGLTAHKQGATPNSPTTALSSTLSSARTFPAPRSSGAPSRHFGRFALWQ